LAQKIAETRYFDQVIICDSVIIPSGPESTLSGSQIDSLIYSLGVDMLLAVERVQLEMTTDEMWFSEVRREIPVLCVGITPLVGAYKEMRDRPLFKICKTDTLYWELPLSLSLEMVKEDASQYAATIPMKHLLPYWGEVHRFYFDGGIAEMRDAGIYVREQNWDAAAELWRSVYGQKKGKCRIHAAFNLALYHELKNEFELALAYLDEAFKLSKEGTSERAFIQYYQMQLQEQAKKNKNLQIQMKRFE
jgi:tetratricopeptide (TPR) repeat protein